LWTKLQALYFIIWIWNTVELLYGLFYGF
jgi:hypothetical protein